MTTTFTDSETDASGVPSSNLTDEPFRRSDNGGRATHDSGRLDSRSARMYRIAWCVLGLQLIGMLIWSALLYSRYANTWDYELRYQAWWQIAHGNLNPYISIAGRNFWQDHFELINWPLAPLARIWPGGLWPMWIQDVMVVAGEGGALLLVTDAIRAPRWPQRFPGWMAVVLVVVLLVANPWIYDTVSYDFHYQSVGAACFALLAMREMLRGSLRWMALWVALCLACGDIAGTYLAAIGISGLLAGRDSRRRGAVLLALGAGWFMFASAVGGNQGSGFSGHYGYLTGTSGNEKVGVGGLAKGIALHPVAILRHLWIAKDNLWAYAMSAGGLGLLTPLSVLPLLVLFESGAGQGSSLSATAYENFGAVLFIAPLTVLALAALTRNLTTGRASKLFPRLPHRSGLVSAAVRILVVLLAVDAIAWGIIWIPKVPAEWLRTSAPAASALRQAERLIPGNAEVVVSEGVGGRFCGRQWCYRIEGNGTKVYPFHTSDVYFVITPYQGIESASVQSAVGVIGELAGPLHATLLLSRNGVWLFRVHRPPNAANIVFQDSPTEPAWALESATGAPDLAGPAAYWNMSFTTSRVGYLLFGSYWNLLPGTYEATVTLSTTVRTDIEVWDATTETLLNRRDAAATDGRTAVQSVFTLTKEGDQTLFSGWGPFSWQPGKPYTRADQTEVRVWTPAPGDVQIYSIEIQPYK